VVHVSRLKKALPPEAVVSSDDTLHTLSSTLALVPAQVLDTKLAKVGHKVVPLGLVQWTSVCLRRGMS
jgi:hypothetical protein